MLVDFVGFEWYLENQIVVAIMNFKAQRERERERDESGSAYWNT